MSILGSFLYAARLFSIFSRWHPQIPVVSLVVNAYCWGSWFHSIWRDLRKVKLRVSTSSLSIFCVYFFDILKFYNLMIFIISFHYVKNNPNQNTPLISPTVSQNTVKLDNVTEKQIAIRLRKGTWITFCHFLIQRKNNMKTIYFRIVKNTCTCFFQIQSSGINKLHERVFMYMWFHSGNI